MTIPYRPMQVGDRVRAGFRDESFVPVMGAHDPQREDDDESKDIVFGIGNVIEIDNGDNTIYADFPGVNPRSASWVWWMPNSPCPYGIEYADCWPTLYTGEPIVTVRVEPVHIETVFVGKHQKVPDRVIQEMIDRGERLPRRTLARWPEGKLWKNDGGKRTVTGNHQDSFTVSWYWEEVPIEQY